MGYIKKEIKFHSMVKSEFCVRLHNKIETKNHMYMIQDYCNGLDLAVLLEIRKKLTQQEVGLILRHVVGGLNDIWDAGIIHRDIKLANVLLNFPDNPKLRTMSTNDQ